MKKKTPFISKLYVALIFVFLYAPILVMMLFSLNSTSSTYIFSGFSTHWYNEMFKDTVAVQALKNTVLLAVCTALVSFWVCLRQSDCSIQNQSFTKVP